MIGTHCKPGAESNAKQDKLRLELIPKPLWGLNLRSNIVGIGPRAKVAITRLFQRGEQTACGCQNDDRGRALGRRGCDPKC
jgi:hypothetical protein